MSLRGILHVVFIAYIFGFIFIKASSSDIVFQTDNNVKCFRGINWNKWSKTGRMTLKFSVNASKNAMLAMSSNRTVFRPRYVLVIENDHDESFYNYCPEIGKCRRYSIKKKRNLLNPLVQRKFWVSWQNQKLAFGTGFVANQNVMLSVKMKNSLIIDYIGIKSLTLAEWTFENDNITEISTFNSETCSSDEADVDQIDHLSECVCPCSDVGNNWIEEINLTMDELKLHLKDRLTELQNNITVDRKQTTAYKSRKMSAKDNRRSSALLGWISIICICIPIMLAVIADCTRCII